MKQVTAAVIERKGQYLIARRAPSQSHAGRWEFPGGKIEPGETAEECLKREIEEEFGVRVRVGRFITASTHTYPGGTIQLLAYETVLVSGDFDLRVHDQIAWVRPSELLGYELLPADIPIARTLQQMTGCK